MCGRFTLTIDAALLAEVFRLDTPPEHQPRFNVAPTQDHPVVVSHDGRRIARPMRWGLVPSWAKDPSIGSRMINARSETAPGKPSFRAAVARRRCLVPADGFFEWVKTGDGKQPLHIRRPDRRPFAMAGLWESWRDSEGADLVTFTILTTEAAPPLDRVHHRMPVILPAAGWDEWTGSAALSEDRFAEITAPLLPFRLEGRPVSRAVNRPTVDEPSVLESTEGPGGLAF